MNIEEEIFKKSYVDINELISFGFKKDNDKYTYSKKILDDNFEVIVTFDKNSKISGKIIDLEMDEEYITFRNLDNNGSFVNTIRDEYINILNEIKDKCCISNYYIFSQSNRVTKYIMSKYKDNPEFLWDKYPGCGIFRNKRNKKWYAAILNVDRSKITKGSGEIEVLDIKLSEDMVNSLLKENNYYEAYHMNKKSWITIILDDSLSDEIVFSLIDISYKLIDSSLAVSSSWIIPANPKIYDISGYNEGQIIEWKQTSKVNIHDIAYIYIGSPYSSLIYKGEIIDKDIPFYYESANLKMTKVMKIRIIKKYSKDEYPLSKLKSFGLTSVRSIRRIGERLNKELDSD